MINTLLKFTTEINELNYPVAYGHWEASPAYNYRALIYAYRANNIALTGKGTLDGQASADVWWNWKHQIEHTWSESKVSLQEKASNQLRDMNNSGVPVREAGIWPWRLSAPELYSTPLLRKCAVRRRNAD